MKKIEFSKIRNQVFAFNPTSELSRINRDESIFAALQASENYKGVFFFESLFYAKQAPDSMQIVLQSIESLCFAMRWIFKACYFAPSIMEFPSERSKSTILELIKFSQIYAPLDQLLDTVSAGFAEAERLPDGTISVSQPDLDLLCAYYANGRLSRNQALVKARPELMKEPDPDSISAAMESVVVHGPRKYSFTTSAFERCLANHDAKSENTWFYPASASLGNYTFGEFRDFWTCLYTMCMLHICVCYKLKQHVNQYKTRFAWAEEISQRSGLPIDTTLLILNDLVYTPSLYQRYQQQPNIASQPFFPVGENDQLALSNILVIPTDAERNIWELTSILRPTDFSRVESYKEKLWAKDTLVPWLKGLGYGAWSHIKFDKSEDSEGGDVDLFVVDKGANFALAVELKWLKGDTTLKEFQHVNEELRYAAEIQSPKSINWLKTCPSKVLQVTNLTMEEFSELHIEPLVVSRNSLGGPQAHQFPVPVINEFLMQMLLDKPHKTNLQGCLKVARNRSYLPRYLDHFVINKWEEEYAGLKFQSYLNPKTLREWDVRTDMGL